MFFVRHRIGQTICIGNPIGNKVFENHDVSFSIGFPYKLSDQSDVEKNKNLDLKIISNFFDFLLKK